MSAFVLFNLFNNLEKRYKMRGLPEIYLILSHNVASGSEIMPCNKFDKLLVVYRFSGNVITSITTLRTYWQNYNGFTAEMRFQSYLI